MARQEKAEPGRSWEIVCLWAFPLAIWLVGTGFFLFDLGKYSDDWAVSLRVPETDMYAWPGSPWERWNYFWRPLHLMNVYGLGTVFWHHDWVNHLVSALAHLGVAALLYRLLRTLGVGRMGASAGMCVFLAFPIAHEAVLWPAALGSVVSVGWFIVIAMMCARLARLESVLGRGDAARWCLGLGMMSFLCACWHEQGAACVCALPCVMWAAGAGPKGEMQRRASIPHRQDAHVRLWKRVMMAMGACGAGVAGYIALFAMTVPRHNRGGTQTLVDVDGVGARVVRLFSTAWEVACGARGRDVVRDAWRIGRGAIADAPAGFGWCAIALACGLGIVYVRASVRSPAGERTDARRGWIVLFGVVAAAASLLPIGLVARQPMNPRYLYAAGMGFAIIVGAGADAVMVRTRAGRRRTAWGAVLACAAGAAGIAGAVCCVGVQAQFRARWLSDEDQMAQLLRLVPEPVRGAVFVPVDVRDGRRVDLRRNDPGVMGGLAQPWSCWAYVQRGYGRSDVSATHWRTGARSPVGMDERGVTYARGVADWKGRAGENFVPWERVVVFTVDEKGIVRVMGRAEAQRMGGRETR